jgi:peptidyl-prolyl cis-trans isomerase C
MICIKKTGAVVALALLLPFGAAQAQEVSAGTVLATVGGVEITVGHMIAARGVLPAEYWQLPDDMLFAGLLDQLIQQNALAQSLPADLGVAAQRGLDNQISGFLAGEALDRVTESALTEEALQAAYQARFADMAPGTEFNASHILVTTEEEAVSLKGEIDAGADFATMAQEHSTGPSGPNGGALGWFGEGMMVPPFEAAVMELDVGEVSGPVQTQFGWHLVKLNETRMMDAPALEEVRGALVEELRAAAIEAELERVTSDAEITRVEIEIDPSVIRDMSLLVD